MTKEQLPDPLAEAFELLGQVDQELGDSSIGGHVHIPRERIPMNFNLGIAKTILGSILKLKDENERLKNEITALNLKISNP